MQSFGGKTKGFSDHKCNDLQQKKVGEGTAGVAINIELQNFMATKLKVNFFAFLLVALLVSQVTFSGQKNDLNLVGTVWIVLRAHLDTCLCLSSIDEVASFVPLQASQNG